MADTRDMIKVAGLRHMAQGGRSEGYNLKL